MVDPLHMGTASAALVYDTSVFGPTSPWPVNDRGSRSPRPSAPSPSRRPSRTTGGTSCPRRSTRSPRGLITTAATGSTVETSSVSALPGISRSRPRLRGGSIHADECAAGPSGGTCETYDRLSDRACSSATSSSVSPSFGRSGASGACTDRSPSKWRSFSTAAWRGQERERPTIFGGDRRAGVEHRRHAPCELFGFAVAQMDLAYPFQRPGRGWVWAFKLSPGF